MIPDVEAFYLKLKAVAVPKCYIDHFLAEKQVVELGSNVIRRKNPKNYNTVVYLVDKLFPNKAYYQV
ncbi:hypothetical protein MKX03_006168 [Papaver bracteatum]|nr:hypothetical protein MKX03_006168 [Papaver bracteatum]